MFFPLKTERVPVANQQCGLHSGLTVICLFIQDNKRLTVKNTTGWRLDAHSKHCSNVSFPVHI